MKSLTKLSLLFTIAIAAAQAHGGVITWDGGAGTMNWADANNWNPNLLPGPADDVVIDIAGAATVSFAAAGTTINSIVCNENLTCTGGQLGVATTADMNGNITLNGGALSGGTWDVAGALICTASANNRVINATINGNITLSALNAALRVQDGLTLNGAATVSGLNARIVCVNTQTIHAGTFILNGTAIGAGHLGVEAGATLTLAPGVIVRLGLGEIGASTTPGVSTLINQGQIVAHSDTSAGLIDPGVLLNQGSILADAGALTIANTCNWSSTGQIVVQSQASLNLGGAGLETADLGTVQNNPGGKLNVTAAIQLSTPLTLNAFTGSWTLNAGSFNNGTLNIVAPAALTITSAFQNKFNNVVLNGNLTLSSSSATLQVQNGLTLNGAVTVTGPNARIVCVNTLTIAAGTFTLTGPVANNTLFAIEPDAVVTLAPAVTLQGGRVNIGPSLFEPEGPGGQLINQGQILATVAQAPVNLSPGVLDNQGLIAADAAPLTIGAGTQIANHHAATGTLTGGTWRAGSAQPLTFPAGVNILRNNATLVRGAGSGFPAMNLLFENQAGGVVDLQSGAITVITPAGGMFINDGELSIDSPGSLTVQGSYAQSNNGSLDLLTDTANFTFVFASVAASLNGGLAVALEPGFSPLPESQFNAVQSALLTGTFDSLAGCDSGALSYTLTSAIYTFTDGSGGTPGDFNGDALVNGIDLGIMLAAWGPCDGCCIPDLNDDGSINGVDLGILLANWTQR